MKALYYWIIVFVLFASVIGLFMFPFIHWLSNFSELYVVLSLGGVLLILSIIFFRLQRKKEYKLSAMIAFPFALTFLIGGGIHYARFSTITRSRANCLIYSHNDLYSKFGVYIATGNSGWIQGWLNGELVLLDLYSYSVYVGQQTVYLRDSDGEIMVSSYSGDLLESECSKYKVTYKMSIYDKNGEYIDFINGEFYYTVSPLSSDDYRYEYYETISGKEHSSTFDYSLVKDEIIAQSGNQLSY